MTVLNGEANQLQYAIGEMVIRYGEAVAEQMHAPTAAAIAAASRARHRRFSAVQRLVAALARMA